MVDFRYHLVSIVSVFLALALGIVIGTTALNGQLPGDLANRVEGLSEDKRGLEDALREQQRLTAAGDEVVGRMAPGLVADVLQDQRVLLLSTADVPSGVPEQLTSLLEAAGATVPVVVQLRPALTDPARRDELAGVLGGVSEDPLTEVVTGLASALVGREGRLSVDDAEAARILTALEEQDLVEVARPDALPGAPADLAVLLVSDAGPDLGPGQREQLQGAADTVVALAAALDRSGGGTVVAGARPGGQGALDAVRGDDLLSAVVASVDGVDGPLGRLATVLSLAEQECGRSGRYGSGDGTDGALPRPCPP